ncbi:nuclear transport factor 2 family protein [Jiella sonneratiae]|uniref:Nuclear transport factor 2 family protein n=1 Tax=Jiella sonneratiae TaxID=2816856 RepID=A0ABS3J9J6_9HYPH|nr:nuclear transport factor 2 family protein [Jiella sonneratiae]MBO0906344.1 nuclear transport factor 2 family protein [Jiella sonneratiae]
MADSERVAILRHAYRCWVDCSGADRNVWLDFAADDPVLHSLQTEKAQHPLAIADIYRGREEIGAYFDAMERDWEPLSYDPQTFIEQGDEVAVFSIVKVRAKATNKVAHTWLGHWWTFDGNRFAKLVEVFDGTRALMAMTPD